VPSPVVHAMACCFDQLLKGQVALSTSLRAARTLACYDSDAKLATSAEACFQRSEALFCNTVAAIKQVVCQLEPPAAGPVGAKVVEKVEQAQAEYKELSVETDSLVAHIRRAAKGSFGPLAAQDADVAGFKRWTEATLSVDSLVSVISSSSSADSASGDESREEPTASGESDDGFVPAVGRCGVLRKVQQAVIAIDECCTALSRLSTQLQKQSLMKEHVQCLLQSGARSPALRHRFEQQLAKQASLSEAFVADCQQYCDGYREFVKAPSTEP